MNRLCCFIPNPKEKNSVGFFPPGKCISKKQHELVTTRTHSSSPLQFKWPLCSYIQKSLHILQGPAHHSYIQRYGQGGPLAEGWWGAGGRVGVVGCPGRPRLMAGARVGRGLCGLGGLGPKMCRARSSISAISRRKKPTRKISGRILGRKKNNTDFFRDPHGMKK